MADKAVNRLILVICMYFLGLTFIFNQHHIFLFPYSANNALKEEQIRIDIKVIDCFYKNGKVEGMIMVKNKGNAIRDLNGKYPINIGVSIIDNTGEIINLDYGRICFESDQIRKRQTSEIKFEFEGLEQIYHQNGGLRFAIVQEGVSWFNSSSICYLDERSDNMER